MEPEGSLSQSQVPPVPIISLGPRLTLWLFRNMIRFYCEALLAPRPSPKLGTTPSRLSATAYSIYSQLLFILGAVSASATWEHAMPWWQGPTDHGNVHTTIPVSSIKRARLLCDDCGKASIMYKVYKGRDRAGPMVPLFVYLCFHFAFIWHW